MKTLNLAAAAVAAVAAPLPASAQAAFDGPYVGVQGGWNGDDVTTVDTPIGALGPAQQRDSVVGGIFAGYDFRATDRIVLGGEAGISVGNDDALSRTSRGVTFSIDPRYSFDVTARAGYLVTPTTLVYARGGYANTRVRADLGLPNGALRGSTSLDGWVAGGGIEQGLSARVSARAEYRFSKLGSGDGKYDRHQALIGVAYRF